MSPELTCWPVAETRVGGIAVLLNAEAEERAATLRTLRRLGALVALGHRRTQVEEVGEARGVGAEGEAIVGTGGRVVQVGVDFWIVREKTWRGWDCEPGRCAKGWRVTKWTVVNHGGTWAMISVYCWHWGETENMAGKDVNRGIG